MAAPSVFFVYLRRPRPNDLRTDPLYEFGSFGCTKCHCKNLFHPRHAGDLEGAQLAFVQGGDEGSRLVFLTPPITVKVWADNCEACWTPPEMPFKYCEAPVLVANNGTSDFRGVKQFARGTDCPSLESGLSSRLRSRSHPLSPEMARQLVSAYEQHREEKGPTAIAATYDEALPYVTKIDRNRQATYRRLLRKLRDETNGRPPTLNDHGSGATRSVGSQCRLPCRRTSKGRTKRCT
jgi:hypothetical protein